MSIRSEMEGELVLHAWRSDFTWIWKTHSSSLACGCLRTSSQTFEDLTGFYFYDGGVFDNCDVRSTRACDGCGQLYVTLLCKQDRKLQDAISHLTLGVDQPLFLQILHGGPISLVSH